MMELIESYTLISDAIKASVKRCGYVLRPRAGAGLWLVPLIPTALLVGSLKQIFREKAAMTHVYFATTLVSVGLLMASVIYVLRFVPRPRKEMIGTYWFGVPAISTLLLLLITQNHFLLSILGGILSTYGVLAGIPTLLAAAPGCFTIGEAAVLVHALVLFVYSAIFNIVHAALTRNAFVSDMDDLSFEISTIILQVGGLSVLAILATLVLFPTTREPPMFYMLLSSASFATVIVLHILLGGSPILWIFLKITHDQGTFNIFLWWLGLSILGCGFVYCQVSQGSKASTSQRKIFHILAVIVFTTGLLWIPDILYLASGVCFALFLILEASRLLSIPPLGSVLRHGFLVFGDEKDTLLSLTPLYLLGGISAPLWLSPMGETPIAPSRLLPYLAGVLSIGIGDTAASFIGSNYGQTKWPGSNRTIEGTIACFLAQVGFVSLWTYYGILTDDLMSLIKSFVAIALTSLLEAKTDQVDNLVLPLVLYILSC